MTDAENLWRKRANEAVDKAEALRQVNTRLTEALERIQHMGYAGDPWVDAASEALRPPPAPVSPEPGAGVKQNTYFFDVS